jgi:hypothetical protein
MLFKPRYINRPTPPLPWHINGKVKMNAPLVNHYHTISQC